MRSNYVVLVVNFMDYDCSGNMRSGDDMRQEYVFVVQEMP